MPTINEYRIQKVNSESDGSDFFNFIENSYNEQIYIISLVAVTYVCLNLVYLFCLDFIGMKKTSVRTG